MLMSTKECRLASTCGRMTEMSVGCVVVRSEAFPPICNDESFIHGECLGFLVFPLPKIRVFAIFSKSSSTTPTIGANVYSADASIIATCLY